MKKILIALVAMLALSVANEAQAQSIFTFGGNSRDSIRANDSFFTAAQRLNGSQQNIVSWQWVHDAVSGTPGYVARLQYSNDGSNWINFGTTSRFYRSLAPTGDTTFINDTTAYPGFYFRIHVDANGTAQKSLWKAVIKTY
jgi:hypothetical protein